MPGAVSVDRELLGQGGSSAVLSADAINHAAEVFRRSAKKLTHPRLNLATARDTLRQHAKTVIYGAFPAASRHQTCMDAAYACGCSPDTILRLIEGGTANPDVLVLGHCDRIYRDRTGNVTPITTLLAQLIAAEVKP
jgi:hypothetical protein